MTSSILSGPEKMADKHPKKGLSSVLSEPEKMADKHPSKSSEDVPRISLRDFLDPWNKWVVVPNGSWKGYFDWLPEKLRVGPWSPMAPIFLVTYVATIIYTKPQPTIEFDYELTRLFPEAHSAYWYYNLIGFLWTLFILHTSLKEMSPTIFLSYTYQSWTAICIRHGISAAAPFLPSSYHMLFQIHEILRFHCLVTATVTFTLWNFAIMPVIYFKGCNTDIKKKKFIKFFFGFNLVQAHLLNIVYAILNTIISSPRRFIVTDLWCSMATLLAYTLFYLLFMDRIGVHFYPVFSPRAHWCILTYSACVGCYVATYFGWNKLISKFIVTSAIAS